jgi:Uri superfamily endonuclease
LIRTPDAIAITTRVNCQSNIDTTRYVEKNAYSIQPQRWHCSFLQGKPEGRAAIICRRAEKYCRCAIGSGKISAILERSFC